MEYTKFENANGYTFSGDSLISFSTLVIADGKVVEVGGKEVGDAYPEAQSVDVGGKTMLPGLIDAHGHVMGLGFQELNVNLVGVTSLEETLEKVKAYADANPELEWIEGRGWNQVLWDGGEFPTAGDLDQIVSDRPVWLARVDGHAAWGNSKAMQIAGISQDTPDPQGGKIMRDERGRATGIFVDAAENYIQSQIPAPTKEIRELALDRAMLQLSKMGITAVHDAGITVNDWELYTSFADKGALKARIYAMIGGAGTAFDSLSENGPIESYADDMLALRSVKLYSDGALGSRGAAMLQPYSDDPGNKGLLFVDQEEMNQMILKTSAKGYQTNVHAIGDAGNRQVLDAFEYAKNQLGDQALRHRIEHAQIVDIEDIPRFKDLDIIASMQPTHATSDLNMAEDRVGPHRIKGGYAWQTFLEQGTIVAAGSDFPVEHSNPFFGLYSAVTRMTQEGTPPEGWYPEEALSREQALKSFTVDAAYSGHQEKVLGSLESGKWADFILIDRDYFEVPVTELW
ncbi:MAG: amidohydrolase, partial [Bacteroidota bacterium]